MRIIHTADWHLGKSLERISRLDEQAAFIDELCALVRSEAADLVLIAGDVFDTVNPPAAAEALFCDALERLGDGGRRAVVVIAGNHDSPERLVALRPLAAAHGVFLSGTPGDEAAPANHAAWAGDAGRVRCIAAGPSWLELALPHCDETVIIGTLPYPSEARLRSVLADTLDEQALQLAYSDQVQQYLGALSRQYRPDAVRLAMTHVYVTGGIESDSERPIQLGGALSVRPEAFPVTAQYVALGHLHRPQAVPGASVPARYAGSPLAYSFSEAGYAKSVVRIDAAAHQVPAISLVPLSAGKALVRWKATGGLAEVRRWCEEGRDRHAYVDVELHLTEALTMEEIQQLRAMHPGFVHIRPVFPAQAPPGAAASRTGVPVEELFRQFYVRQRGGPPAPELVRLFLELVQEGQPDESEEAMPA